MELLLLILLGGTFALWVSNQNLKRRVTMVEQRLGALDGGAAQLSPDYSSATAPVADAPAAAPEPAPVPEPVPAATYTVGHTRMPEVAEEIGERQPNLMDRLIDDSSGEEEESGDARQRCSSGWSPASC